MPEAVVRVRKWGNSMGVILPCDVVGEEKIKPDDKVIISIKKVPDINDLFGVVKRKKSGQQMKDEMRAGWD